MTQGEEVAFERDGFSGTGVAYELRDGFWRVRLYLNEPSETRPNLDINVSAHNANTAVDAALDTLIEGQRE